IEQHFGVTIKCNSAYEYYIDASETMQDEAFRSWVLDSYALRTVLTDNKDISSRIHVEAVPSARDYLSPVLSAIRESHRVMFSYAPFNRSGSDDDILFEPYFVKLFDRRWYMVGRRVADSALRTYALDRITVLRVTPERFNMPETPTAGEYFSELFGITQSGAEAVEIKLRVEAGYARYLRALAMHESQKEEVFDTFSIFNYRMKLTPDLVRHILSLGASVTVLAPKELRAMVVSELNNTIKNYE
ncbi:MAG: WYL domain-containing protein, partial [Muribaculaceae bacterium]|nr:WYL domain-containing protein [Muribaculaceae bacterium]